MTYIPPTDVISPQENWQLNCVLYDGGQGGIAVAWGLWNEEDSIGIRWNGTSEPGRGLGNPQSSGHPTWFMMPHDFGIAVMETMLLKKAIGNNTVNSDCLNKVIQWMIVNSYLQSELHY